MGDTKTLMRVIGGAMTIGGIVAGIFAAPVLVTALLMNAGAAMIIAAKQYGLARERDAWNISQPSPTASIPVIYGRVKIGLRIADYRIDPSDTDILWVVGAVCDGGMRSGYGVEDWREIYFDDRLAVNAAGVVQSPFSGYLSVWYHDGADNQTHDTNLYGKFPDEWPVTSDGKGVAYLVFKLTKNEKAYPSGVPNIQVIVDGPKVYDSDAAAWVSSTNNAWCVRDLLTSSRYGLGAPASELEETSLNDSADHCDELVSIPDGAGGSTTQKRFTCNGVVDTSKPVQENLNRLLPSCRGMLTYQAGKFRLYIPQTETAEAFVLDESNIIGDWEFEKHGVRDVANIMEATFIDADLDYISNVARFPQVGESNPFLTNDNDFEARRKIDLPFTNNIYMAEQICDTLLKETRNDITLAVTVKQEAMKLQVGDVAEVTHETPGFSSKEFRALAMAILQDGNLRLVLKEYTDATYTFGSQSDAADYKDSNLPDPYTVAYPTSLAWASTSAEALETNSGEIVRAKVTWTHSTHGFLAFEDLFYRKNGDSDWMFAKRVGYAEAAIGYLAELDAGVAYDVAVRAVNTLGVQSNMATLSNQTAYDPSAFYPGDPPADPASVVLDVVVQQVEVELLI